MSEPLAESLSAEVAQAAAIHAEATEKARQAQMSESESRIVELVTSQLTEVIEHAFFVPAEPGKQKKFIDITQIPRICDDITSINNTLWWLSRIAGVVGTILVLSIGAFVTLLAAYISAGRI